MISQSIRSFSMRQCMVSITRNTRNTNCCCKNYTRSIFHIASAACTSNISSSQQQVHSQFQYRPFSDDSSDSTSTNTKNPKQEIDLSKFTKTIEVKLPELVEDNKAKIVQWYKKEGDIINPNETICDIETELFTFGYAVEDECLGLMKEIILKEGEETNDMHTPICIILHEDDGENDDNDDNDEIDKKKEEEEKKSE